MNDDLVGQFTRQSHFGAAYCADHIAAIGDLFHPHAFTKTHLPQAFAGGAIEEADVKFTAHFSLFQRDQCILLEFMSDVRGGGHNGMIAC